MKCPKCGKKIDKILNTQSGFVGWYLFKNGDFEEQIPGDNFGVDDRINDFCCPECKEIIADSEKEALEMLNKA